MKLFYVLIRIYTIISSLFIIPYATYYILNTSPDWEGFPAPSLQHRLLIGLPILLFGMLLLSPHRWMKLEILFYSKFSFLILFSIFLLVGGLLGINAYLTHDKHWLLVFISLPAIMLSICSPLTLWMKRKIGEISKGWSWPDFALESFRLRQDYAETSRRGRPVSAPASFAAANREVTQALIGKTFGYWKYFGLQLIPDVILMNGTFEDITFAIDVEEICKKERQHDHEQTAGGWV